MELIDYWPTKKHVDECIRTDADAASQAVLLAVHQQMHFSKIRIETASANPVPPEDITEKDLLDTFLGKRPPQGIMILPIVGDSGIGKSHAIRWLHAALQSAPDSDLRHVILIPKSSSLKQVLKLVVKDLEGPAYEQIKEDIKQARDRLDPLAAREKLRANILIAIKRKSEDASRQLVRQGGRRTDQVDPENQTIDNRLTLWKEWSKHLVNLLEDPVTSIPFMQEEEPRGVIADLANRITETQHGETTRTQFEAEDFERLLDGDTTVASKPATAAANKLKGHTARSTKNRDIVVDLLNEIIDEAIKELFDGGENSLYELFLQVRKQFLEDGRELVLLVEDFAVLAGIQGSLLDVIKKDAIVGGDQEFCVMRTALAATEGYMNDVLKKWDTFATRARYKWKIEKRDKQDDQQTIDSIVKFCGAYLNAARIGQHGLKTASDTKSGIGDREWIPKFDDTAQLDADDNNKIEGFGRTIHEYSLFPLNRAAIGQLAKRYCTEQDGLIFQPRKILNDILRKSLEYRKDFDNATFPPQGFHNFESTELSPDVRQYIHGHWNDPEQRRQANATIRFWGDNPSSVQDLRIEPGVLEAFSLSVPQGTIAPEPVRPSGGIEVLDETEPVPPSTVDDPETQRKQKEIKDLEDHIRKLLKNKALPQNPSNKFRNWVKDAVVASLDSDHLLIKIAKTQFDAQFTKLVYLGYASGGQPKLTPTEAFVTIATKEEMDDEVCSIHVEQLLLAIVRHRIHGDWTYKEADTDYPRYANFLEKATSQAEQYLINQYFKQTECTGALVESLLFGARLLNVEGAHSDKNRSLIRALFADEPSVNHNTADQDAWETLVANCSLQRQDLRTLLLEQVAARQSGSETVLAIDAARLMPAIKNFKQTWCVKSPLPDAKTLHKDLFKNVEAPDAKDICAHVKVLCSDRTKQTIQKKHQGMATVALQWKNAFGEPFDKDVICEKLREVLTELNNESRAPDDLEILRSHITRFKESAATDCFNQLVAFQNSDDFGAMLSNLARLDDRLEKDITQLSLDADRMLTQVTTAMDSAINTIGGDVVRNEIDTVNQTLNNIQNTLSKLQQDPGVGESV